LLLPDNNLGRPLEACGFNHTEWVVLMLCPSFIPMHLSPWNELYLWSVHHSSLCISLLEMSCIYDLSIINPYASLFLKWALNPVTLFWIQELLS
jgi:hypothetical protein